MITNYAQDRRGSHVLLAVFAGIWLTTWLLLLLPLVLESTGGNKAQAARILGMTRLTLRTKLRELGWSETRSVEGDDDDPD